MPAVCSSHKRRSIHRSRALHVIVMALNFWHSGGSFPDDHQLQRSPNRLHQTLYKRIRALLRSDGPAFAFEATKAGRRFPELVARLGELSEVLTKNGCSASPYEKSFVGVEVPKDDTTMPELQPYRDLNPSRLALAGCGLFDATDHLSDPLVMPYREPEVLSFPNAQPVRVPVRDSCDTLASLGKLWDKQGLLYIHRENIDPSKYVRIFNAYKSIDLDRQIGDRRSANALEARISDFGPSSCLPAASDFSELSLNPRKQTLAISITDRRDFYHQFWASRKKALVNTLGPPVEIEALRETTGFSLFALENSKKKYRRERHGDMLHGKKKSLLLPEKLCHISFKSILQGDHCGVDIATDAHTHILQEAELLLPDSMLVATRPLRDPRLCQGLVIDDFFAISVEDALEDPSQSLSRCLYDRSQKVYQKYSLLGSPHKDILGESSGKVIGAWLDASPSTRRRGLCTVSAPAQKRIGLSHVSLKLAQMSHTSDVLHLCAVGGWVSAMGFRRPTYSLFNHAYKLVDNDGYQANNPKLVPLPRSVANELVLASVLHPLMMTDIGSRYHDRIFATDASSHRGAICSCPVDVQTAEVVWKCSKSKGSYTRLMTPSETLLRRLGIREEVDDQESSHKDFQEAPKRPLAYRFDFIEVFAGVGGITKAIANLGVSVGPPIELSYSEEYDVSESHVQRWLTYLVSSRLVLAIVCEPPCTTYSIIRRPALRSKAMPMGFNTADDKTLTGNRLACRGSQLMKIAGVNRVAGLLETPFSSLLQHFPAWKAAAAMPCSRIVRVDSCRFGSPHLKSFRMLCVHFLPDSIDRRCVCQCRHLQVQGKYTKASATYTEELCAAIALDLARWIWAEQDVLRSDNEGNSKGLESLAINDLALSADWKVDVAWNFSKPGHINLLEEASLLRLAQRCAHLGCPTRITAMVDSNVVRGATSKGRSSSLGLSSVLRRFNAVCVSAALYFHIPFVPTRHNTSDDPTRLVKLRTSIPGFDLASLDRDTMFDLCSMPRLRRWASNWARLILRYAGLHLIHLSCRNKYRKDFSDPSAWLPLDFDKTLGFPGEGPLGWIFLFTGLCLLVLYPRAVLSSGLCGSLGFRRCACWCPSFVCWVSLFWSLQGRFAMAMPISPGTPAEFSKAAARRDFGPLPEGRPVLPATGSARERFLNAFLQWASAEGIDTNHLLEFPSTYVEEINVIMSRYGRALYGAGKTYNQYAETINALTSLRPSLRRQMQGAWDLGYAWMRQEPSQHHVAMPGVVALAMISTSLMWGWTHFAGCIALAFGALLRPGEVFSLRRFNLLFPKDSGFSVQHLLVSLMEPKTRFTTARHQSTRLDIPDLLEVVTLIFQDLPPHYPIWPFSPQTFRNRFRSVLSALSLPTTHTPSIKCLDPGSLRAGGATWLMQMTDNGELVRRRGRWQNYRIMEVYIQEVSSLLYLQKVPNEGREKVLQTAQCFRQILEKSTSYKAANLPTTIWFVLFSSWKMPWANGDELGTVKSYALVETGFWWESAVATCNYNVLTFSKLFTKLCHLLTQLNERKKCARFDIYTIYPVCSLHIYIYTCFSVFVRNTACIFTTTCR